MSFNDQFDEHGAWRRDFALRLKSLTDWLADQDLLDASVEERLRRLETQVRSDKVMVAFVAEFSRGKSELINSIFFAGYGRRIMPAGAGRTTMCPTELGWEPEFPACLRLLPIQTRLKPQSLAQWRASPQSWRRIELDVNNAEQLAQALEKVAEVALVSKEEAMALGFWHDDTPDENPPCTANGLVEVPRWRHALINMAHPLLKQGLVILDTPGLNAIGAEPELTMSLIPQAHAVVFILGADTGVTRSDLNIWREHLAGEGAVRADGVSRLVVLNKIDTLWDGLSSSRSIQAQVRKQIDSTADILGVPRDRVLAVSAQKGLLAKIKGDAAALQASCLPVLEQALGQGMVGQRQAMLRRAAARAIEELRTEAGRALHVRSRALAEQVLELNGLRGKNASVIRQMRLRIEQEHADFEAGGARIQAVRSVHLSLLREVFFLLGAKAMKTELAVLAGALREPGIKLGAKRAYIQTFTRLRASLQRIRQRNHEIHQMLSASFAQLNAEFGFTLHVADEPDLSRFAEDLDVIERSHLQYLGVGNLIRLSQPDFTHRLLRALSTRLRVIHESALSEIEFWNQSVGSQLDVQLRDRRRNFARRIEAIDRIQQAASGLDARIDEIALQQARLSQQRSRLEELTTGLVTRVPAHEPARAPATALDLHLT
jgi:hypothetical protein